MLFRLFEQFRSRNDEPIDIESFSTQVEENRKLAIYERETGMYAYWYLELRGEDECNRANRYKWPLTVAFFEQASGANAWALQGALRPGSGSTFEAWMSGPMLETGVSWFSCQTQI